MFKISDTVTWVGKIDWELNRFHGDESVSYTHLDVYKRQE